MKMRRMRGKGEVSAKKIKKKTIIECTAIIKVRLNISAKDKVISIE